MCCDFIYDQIFSEWKFFTVVTCGARWIQQIGTTELLLSYKFIFMNFSLFFTSVGFPCLMPHDSEQKSVKREFSH